MITIYENILDLVILLPTETIVSIPFLDPPVAISSIQETTVLPVGPHQDYVQDLHHYSMNTPHKPKISASRDNPLDTASSQVQFQDSATLLFWYFCRAEKKSVNIFYALKNLTEFKPNQL